MRRKKCNEIVRSLAVVAFLSLIKVSHFLVQPVTSQFPTTLELNGKVKWLLPSTTVEIIPLTSGSSERTRESEK